MTHRIHSDEHSLVAPRRLTAGPTSFTASTSAVGRGWIGLAALLDDDWDGFRRRLRDLVSDDPERIVSASAGLVGSARLLGGAVIHPGRPSEFRSVLEPGTHVFFDYPDTATNDSPRHVLADVTAAEVDLDAEVPGSGDGSARVTAVVTGNGRPDFEVAGRFRAGQPVTFANAMPARGYSEFVLLPIDDGVDDRVLADYFDRFVDFSGDWPDAPPFDVTRGCGCLPLSSGQTSDVVLPDQPGRHVVANWLKSEVDGVRHVKRGQFAIFEVGA